MMKKYEILRAYEKVKPLTDNPLYICEGFGCYFSYACTLIVDGEKYTIEGPDQEAVEFLRKKIEEGNGYLGIPTGGFDANGNHWHGWIPVHFTDEKFVVGIDEAFTMTPFIYKEPEMKLEPLVVSDPL